MSEIEGVRLNGTGGRKMARFDGRMWETAETDIGEDESFDQWLKRNRYDYFDHLGHEIETGTWVQIYKDPAGQFMGCYNTATHWEPVILEGFGAVLKFLEIVAPVIQAAWISVLAEELNLIFDENWGLLSPQATARSQKLRLWAKRRREAEREELRRKQQEEGG